jgi:hypothetical protein
MSSNVPKGYMYTECTRDTKYGYHLPGGERYSNAGAAAVPANNIGTAKKTYTSTYQVDNGTKLPCGHIVDDRNTPIKQTRITSYEDNFTGSKTPKYGAPGKEGYGTVDCNSAVHTTGKKTKCQCPLYTYKRYDKADPVKAEPAHYPANLKSTYIKDYPPKEADRHRMDFAPVKTATKSVPLKDNYVTVNRHDYTPKRARPTTPIRQPETRTTAPVPFKGDTEYFDMTKDAPNNYTYRPVRKPVEPYEVRHGFPEKTEYNHEYTPKRASKEAANAELTDRIIRGTPQKIVGPLDDKTIYKVDYTPKRSAPVQVNAMRPLENMVSRNKPFDGLTIYKKDYLSPEMYQCECPEYEAANFGEHTHNHLHGETIPANNAGHHHIHEVPYEKANHSHIVERTTEHVHEGGPTYKYEKLEKSPLKTAAHTYRETTRSEAPSANYNNSSGKYYERNVDRKTGQPSGNYYEKKSGDARGHVVGTNNKSSHMHYIETMCDDHGSPHKHYIETICPDHHHIHTVDN